MVGGEARVRVGNLFPHVLALDTPLHTTRNVVTEVVLSDHLDDVPAVGHFDERFSH